MGTNIRAFILFLVIQPASVSGQKLNPWTVGDLQCYTKELSNDSTAYYYYEEGLPFTHLYYHEFGIAQDEASEVYLISSELFPTVESSASMALMLYRPYALSAQHQEFHYQGDLAQWNEVEFMADRDIIIIATATKADRTAELTVQRMGDHVDWFIIVNQDEPSEVPGASSLCSL